LTGVDTLLFDRMRPLGAVQAAFTEERALERAARLHQVKHVFLYALNPDHALIRWDEAYGIHPLDDAFTASMKARCPCPGAATACHASWRPYGLLEVKIRTECGWGKFRLQYVVSCGEEDDCDTHCHDSKISLQPK